MKFIKKKGEKRPEISTASLPDIIFMLLFFFMVVTVMREQDLKVRVIPPQASEIEKIENKSLVDYVYLGKPLPKFQEQFGTAPRLQLNNQFSEVDDIQVFVQSNSIQKPEADRGRAITSLRVDKEVTMGIVTDVKTELRRAGQLKVNYSSVGR